MKNIYVDKLISENNKVKKIKNMLNMPGSKVKMLPYITKILPNEMENYYEPFLGGGSLLIDILHHYDLTGDIIVSDIDKNIIDLWNYIKNNITEFNEVLKNTKKEYNDLVGEDRILKYYEFIERFNSTTNSSIEKSILFRLIVQMTKMSRLNYGKDGNLLKDMNKARYALGEYNKKTYKTRVLDINLKEENYIKLSNLIQNVEFLNQSYDKTLDIVINSNKSVIYIDPPYLNTKVNYIDNFDMNNQLILVNKIKDLNRKGNKVIYSNACHNLDFINQFDINEWNIMDVFIRRCGRSNLNPKKNISKKNNECLFYSK
jgi:DNA adenine methylase